MFCSYCIDFAGCFLQRFPGSFRRELFFDLRQKVSLAFHWERKQDQTFAGSLKFIAEGDRVTAINRIGLEDYLLSVISSEMRSAAPLEFLKAHAVISRSWAVARMLSRANPDAAESQVPHGRYDVCADDHCQRYQGLTLAIGHDVRKAVDQTWGKVLKYDGRICDTRFSKCCGGRTELFSTCWEDRDYPYLQSVADPYCNCSDRKILSSVLNDYDLETPDFYSWDQRYGVSELSALFAERTGEDVGEIESLEPVERGLSGRIKYLRVTGTKGSVTIGKELAIRRALSTSHLKSSNFEVTREGDEFVLRGHGWGHGVGLCQIGAAVMASEGHNYKQILEFYYYGASVEEQ